MSISTIRAPEELKTIVVANLTAFTHYFVTVTAFTGPLQHAARDGKAIGPIEYQTLEERMWIIMVHLLLLKEEHQFQM